VILPLEGPSPRGGKTIMDSGQPEHVIAMREDFQQVMAHRYRETIEELTG